VDLTSLPTPCVLIEQWKVERNIERMQDAVEASGKRLRPHAKTHKSPDLALTQIARGAVGICCAKLGEAEVFAEHRITDIRIPYPLNPVNGDRVLALLDRTRLSFVVDHLDVARGWSRVMEDAGREVEVLVKIDVGFHRCGVDPEKTDAADFVARVAELPGLRLTGLLSHAGHAYGAASEAEISAIAAREAQILTTLRDQIASKGVALEEISVGATPTARFSACLDGITELRPGNYVYNDRTQVGLGAAGLADCALTVLATVVTKPTANRLILDSGSKTLSSDGARGFTPITGHGAIFRAVDDDGLDDSLIVERLSEEHATVRVTKSQTALEPGDRVRLIPNHACVVSNLVDEVTFVEGTTVVETVRVAARGKIV
jgi:D-serine deaminase-like pyridoxal phosphate-dependent protein